MVVNVCIQNDIDVNKKKKQKLETVVLDYLTLDHLKKYCSINNILIYIYLIATWLHESRGPWGSCQFNPTCKAPFVTSMSITCLHLL